jgi:hypothetical protein
MKKFLLMMRLKRSLLMMRLKRSLRDKIGNMKATIHEKMCRFLKIPYGIEVD